MFRAIRWLSVLLVCLVGIGLYQGWFSLSSPSPDTESNKVNFNVSVDKSKMKSDVKKAGEKIKEEVSVLADKAVAKDRK